MSLDIRRVGVNTNYVTKKVIRGNFVQKGEVKENGVTRYKEIALKGFNKFIRATQNYDKEGKPIKGSRFFEKVEGPEAKKRHIFEFGPDHINIWV